MSVNIDAYKTSGLTFINTAQRYMDTEPIQNEVTAIGKDLELMRSDEDVFSV